MKLFGQVNVVKGLKMYEELLKEEELTKLIDLVADLREAGQNGKLSGDFFLLYHMTFLRVFPGAYSW